MDELRFLMGELIAPHEYDLWLAWTSLSDEDREAAILADWIDQSGEFTGFSDTEDPFAD